MIIEPKTLSARGALIDLSEVNILLDLIKDSSPNVRLNTLDTLTHLPLPEQGWAQVIRLIRQELQDATSIDDKAQLLEIGTWIPHVFDGKNEVKRIEPDSVVRKDLLDKVERIKDQYNNDYNDYDHDWAASQAPGFVLFTESELLIQKSHLLPEISETAPKLPNWLSNEGLLDIAIENPVLTTLLFEFAAKDDYYNVGLTNNLLEQLARLENFRPDLNGLFKEYHRCVNDWIRDESSYYGEQNARWFQVYRDDEKKYGWNSWQIAWTVSRGGLKGLISALAIHLTDKDETRQIAALALISDSADYTLQRRPAMFGGGIRPFRLDPNQAHRFWLQDAIENQEGEDELEEKDIGILEKVQFTTYHPKKIKPDIWYKLLSYVHLPGALDAVKASSRGILGDEIKNYGKGRGEATEMILREAEIVVVPEMPGCRFHPPRQTLLWLEDWHRVEFRLKANPDDPEFESDRAVNGRVAFYVGPILVAETKIWAHISEYADENFIEQSDEFATSDPYRDIFISYSRKDTTIVEQVERALTTLGYKLLRDVYGLRSGENWSAALLDMIDKADIFQLFWSNNSKTSINVEQEWRHALKLQRQSFIRPTYWEIPMPDPPEELKDIHFAYFGR